MCKSNNADEICQVHIDDYISKYRNGIRPAVFFCFHIRGTVLLALQTRSLESKSTAERPPFAEELVNNPKNFWPLLSSCNLNYSGKDTRGGKYSKMILAAFRDMVKYTQRKAAKHGALINMPAGWTSGRSFSNEREAGEWLLQVTNLDASSTLTVKKKKSSAYQQVQRSYGTPDALTSALQGLNLDERLGSEDIQEVMVSVPSASTSAYSLLIDSIKTAVMQKSSDNKQSKAGQAKQRSE
jgi:hypothetical protein